MEYLYLNIVFAAAAQYLPPLLIGSIKQFQPAGLFYLSRDLSDWGLSFLSHSRELIASICYWNMRPKKSIVSQPLHTRISGQPCGRSRT